MDQKQRAALLSILSNSAIILLKTVVGLMTHSISILSEAMHSAMDLASALIAYFTVTKSNVPADRTHPFGHGKFENLSGTLEALLIGLAGIYIITESVRRLFLARPLTVLPLGIGVMAASALGNWLVYRHNIKVARKTESIALEANAAHLLTDLYTSLGVLAGLVLIALTGVHMLDPLAAIGVALFIIKISWGLMRKAFRDLLDRGLPEAEENTIRAILKEHYPQFVEFHKLRTRRAGPVRYIELHLVLARNVDLIAAHNLSSHLEGEIRKRFPQSQTIIHIEPCDSSCQECPRNCEQAHPGL